MRPLACVLALLALSVARAAAVVVYTPSARLIYEDKTGQLRAVDQLTHLDWLGDVNVNVASHGNVLYASNSSAAVTRAAVAPNYATVQSLTSLSFSGSVSTCAATNTHLCCLAAQSNAVTCKRVGSNGEQQGVDISISFEAWNPVDLLHAIVAGNTHFCALSTQGRVYCWGTDNRFGKLGVSLPTTTNVFFSVARLVQLPTLARALSCSADSCAAISDNSTVIYTWGWLRNHVGAPDDEASTYASAALKHADAPLAARRVIVFNQTALVVADSGTAMYAYGRLDSGVAGQCDLWYTTASPSNLVALDSSRSDAAQALSQPTAQLHASGTSVIGVASSGADVYGWGLNHNRELGMNLRASPYLCPHKIRFATSFTSVLPAPTRVIITAAGTLLLYAQAP